MPCTLEIAQHCCTAVSTPSPRFSSKTLFFHFSSILSRMSPSAALPPSPQEVQRKLSVHSAARPKRVCLPAYPPFELHTDIQATAPPTTPVLSQAHVSGTESDSDSALSPDLASPTSHSLASSAAFLSGTCTLQPPLSAIAERRSGSGGEESEEDDEDEEGWPSADRPGNVVASMEESDIKSGYLWKKGERRKVRLLRF